MSLSRSDDELNHILKELLASAAESECVEFKHDIANPEDIGEYISALSNSAALLGKPYAWLIWGVDNATFELVGTGFDPNSTTLVTKNSRVGSYACCLPRFISAFTQFS